MLALLEAPAACHREFVKTSHLKSRHTEGEPRCIKLLKSGGVCYLGLTKLPKMSGQKMPFIWLVSNVAILWEVREWWGGAGLEGLFEVSYLMILLLQIISLICFLFSLSQLRTLHTVSLLTCETSSSGKLPLLSCLFYEFNYRKGVV